MAGAIALSLAGAIAVSLAVGIGFVWHTSLASSNLPVSEAISGGQGGAGRSRGATLSCRRPSGSVETLYGQFSKLTLAWVERDRMVVEETLPAKDRRYGQVVRKTCDG